MQERSASASSFSSSSVDLSVGNASNSSSSTNFYKNDEIKQIYLSQRLLNKNTIEEHGLVKEINENKTRNQREIPEQVELKELISSISRNDFNATPKRSPYNYLNQLSYHNRGYGATASNFSSNHLFNIPLKTGMYDQGHWKSWVKDEKLASRYPGPIDDGKSFLEMKERLGTVSKNVVRRTYSEESYFSKSRSRENPSNKETFFATLKKRCSLLGQKHTRRRK